MLGLVAHRLSQGLPGPPSVPPFRYVFARVILDSLDVTPEQFAVGTGWEIKPEGACKAEVCVPFDQRPASTSSPRPTGCGMALVHDEQAGLWALGPESLGDRALRQRRGARARPRRPRRQPFRLSSLRGQKVVLVSWAPY